MMVLTDMNTSLKDGDSSSSLYKTVEKYAEEQNIYTTYIGIGLDFDTHLAQQLSGIKGGNYFAVETAEQFKKQMEQDFDYMVTPVVFDTVIKLESKGFVPKPCLFCNCL